MSETPAKTMASRGSPSDADGQKLSAREAFAAIYDAHLWGSDSRSGPGSMPSLNQPYLAALDRLLSTLPIRSVLDLGCGDWALSRCVDWRELDYVGIDIVPHAVERLNAEFGSPRRKFLCQDIVTGFWPDADLVIVKDVLQHLPNAMAAQVLCRLKGRPFAFVTNDRAKSVRGGWKKLWQRKDTERVNMDIAPGGSRPLALRKPPFEFPAEVIGDYEVKFGSSLFVKEMLLWRRLQA